MLKWQTPKELSISLIECDLHTCDFNYFKYIIKLKRITIYIWIIYKNVIKPWVYDFEAYKRNKQKKNKGKISECTY